MKRKLKNKLILELFNITLVAVIGWATCYIVIFKERTIPVIISFVLLGEAVYFVYGRAYGIILKKSMFYLFR